MVSTPKDMSPRQAPDFNSQPSDPAPLAESAQAERGQAERGQAERGQAEREGPPPRMGNSGMGPQNPSPQNPSPQNPSSQNPSGHSHLRQSFYADHFGFHDHPFALMPDPTLILWSREYRRAFSVLEYGVISGAPITLLTGSIGCGKTTLLRELLGRMDETLTVGLISNAQGGRGELMQWILNALGQSPEPGASYVGLFQRLQDLLVAEYAAGRRVLLIFDEAQNLSIESLEELRMLTNINTGKDVLVQLVLTGQPELRDLVRSPRLEQLAQRIAVSYDLKPMDATTTADFIRHRLCAVGGTGREFDAGALAMIHQVSRGVPRLINQFCDISLLYAWTVDTHEISPALLTQVLEDNIFFAAQIAAPLSGPSSSGTPIPPSESRHEP